MKLPDRIYHGTTKHLWAKSIHAPSRICFTRNRADGVEYAYDFAASHDEGVLGVRPTPLLITTRFRNLRGLRLLPDDATEAGAKRKLTWRESLEIGGTFCVRGNIEDLKRRTQRTRLRVYK